MKRPLSFDVAPATGDDKKMKKVKLEESDEESGNHQTVENPGGSVYFDENMLFEVLKHVDAKTLAVAGCVSKQWYKTAQDERLWELICSKQWANTGCGQHQLRTVVLALGGFRRLHALYLGPLSKPQGCSTSSSSWAPVPKVIQSKPQSRLGKDEVHLSLCLMSISCYEKMNFNKSNR
ncbi:hypothetical protein QN277_017844 [Acacia crassicarpa]|uniref:F-box protein GID2 n=1 Tax=Acacia crassicarpa TaxID=499986 RepID=A0AAE1JPV7_9FABA|nr:hypothetical protein QN277_017844 [Acacia crassicarpa]